MKHRKKLWKAESEEEYGANLYSGYDGQWTLSYDWEGIQDNFKNQGNFWIKKCMNQ